VTFYRMPSSATFRSWASRVPPGFTFAVKASRYLTHIRRLRDPREPVEYLMERASELGDRLGPVLLQLPPDLEVDVDGLAETLDAFPRSTRLAVEPRHRSWYTDDVRQVLADRGVALCLADRRRLLMPEWQTADWTYLRFHGGRAGPASCYGEQALTTWAERVERLWGHDPQGFAYFNNDHSGCALRDARSLADLLTARAVRIGRRPEVPDDVVPRRKPAA
jgi:uncharacterized protein YecE (DUF72 family)